MVNFRVPAMWCPPLTTLAVDGYEVFRSPTPTGFDFTVPIAALPGPATLAWTDLGAAAGPSEYYYVVRSTNATFGWRSRRTT